MDEYVHIDFAKGKTCWNYYETVYSCIGCGCCSPDIKTRQQNRARVLKRLLQEQYAFDDWSDIPEIKALQEDNVKINIRYLKRKLRYYEKKYTEGEE